jgi:hypothetical protein
MPGEFGKSSIGMPVSGSIGAIFHLLIGFFRPEETFLCSVGGFC